MSVNAKLVIAHANDIGCLMTVLMYERAHGVVCVYYGARAETPRVGNVQDFRCDHTSAGSRDPKMRN